MKQEHDVCSSNEVNSYGWRIFWFWSRDQNRALCFRRVAAKSRVHSARQVNNDT